MKLHYNLYGTSGPTMVILHGLFGSSDNWHTLAGRFAKDFQVYCLDLRNHGRSGHDYQFDYESLADDLYEFIEDQELNNIFLIGHSMGGKVAMKYAMDFPKSVQKLIVADMAPKAYTPLHNEIIEALENLNLSSISNRQEAENQLSKTIPEAGVRQFLLKNLIRDEQGAFVWRCFLEGISANYTNILSDVQGKPYSGPCLFIRGEKSNYILDEDWQDIVKKFPMALLKTMPNAGHWIHAENPDLFYNLVFEFCQD